MRNTAAAQRPTQRSAWDIPSKTFAQDMQRCQSSAHAPVKASYFHIPKAADTYRSQRIARVAI